MKNSQKLIVILLLTANVLAFYQAAAVPTGVRTEEIASIKEDEVTNGIKKDLPARCCIVCYSWCKCCYAR